jgi:hypothetical protein
MKDRIKQWEKAFDGHKKLTEEVWEDILKKADPEEYESLGDDAACNAMNEFTSAASKFHLGTVDLSSPNSMHGDGCWSDIYRLPGGTTVITRGATYEMSGPSGMVYRGDDYDAMLDIAYELITEDRDYGTVQHLEDGETCDSNADTIIEVDEILLKWKRALKREQRDSTAKTTMEE